MTFQMFVSLVLVSVCFSYFKLSCLCFVPCTYSRGMHSVNAIFFVAVAAEAEAVVVVG